MARTSGLSTLILSGVCWLYGVCAPALAQSHSPLSQIHFDSTPKPSDAEDASLSFGARARLREPVRTISAADYIAPNLREVESDSLHGSVITSKTVWARSTSSACAASLNQFNSCERAKAMVELLQRFNGHAETARSQCEQICGDARLTATLVDLTVQENSGITLSTVSSNSQCAYQLKKSSNSNWKVLRVRDRKCACLPRECT